MIGKLKGVVDEIGEDHCIVDVQGVGYVAWCSARTLAALPSPGEAVVLYIETYVREDVIRLYGFATPVEREWFLLLSSNVQGVGTKVALAVLSTLSPADLANAIALKDIAMVSRAPGVGKKVAERIVVELKNKAPALSGVATGVSCSPSGPCGSHSPRANCSRVRSAHSASRSLESRYWPSP